MSSIIDDLNARVAALRSRYEAAQASLINDLRKAGTDAQRAGGEKQLRDLADWYDARLEEILQAVTPTETYHVPRRFDLTATFALTAAFALVLAIARMTGYGGEDLLIVTALLFCASAAQLIAPRVPRLASTLAGAILLPLWHSAIGGRVIDAGSIGYVLLGGLLGYAAGTIVAGVFLLLDGARQRKKWSSEPDPPPRHLW